MSAIALEKYACEIISQFRNILITATPIGEIRYNKFKAIVVQNEFFVLRYEKIVKLLDKLKYHDNMYHIWYVL